MTCVISDAFVTSTEGSRVRCVEESFLSRVYLHTLKI